MVILEIIIFGASILGEIAYNTLKHNYKTMYFSDNSPNKIGTKFCGVEVIDPNDLINYNEYKVVIASMHYEEIYEQLKNLGIQNILNFFCNRVCASLNNDNYFRYALAPPKDFNYVDKLTIPLNINDIIYDYNNAFLTKPTAHVNRKINYGKKNVLIFGYIFPPLAGGGVQRTLKHVKYLKQLGWNPIVITVEPTCSFIQYDEAMLEEIDNDITVIRFENSFLPYEYGYEQEPQEVFNLICGAINDKQMIEKFLLRVKQSNAKTKDLNLPDPQIKWIKEVLKGIHILINFEKIDIVYTTSNPFSSNLIGFYLKKKYNIKWAADFRDEWINNHFFPVEDKIEIQMEKNLVTNANVVIADSELSAANFVNRLALNKNSVYAITNGYDEDDFSGVAANINPTKVFTMKHNGILYLGNSDPDNVIKAVNSLIDENKINRNNFCIEFVGLCDSYVIERIYALDKYDIVKVLPVMAHRESLKNLSTANLLFSIAGEGENVKRILLGKTLEYLRLHINILALAPKEGETDALINKTKSGMCCEMSDIQGIKDYIYSQYSAFINNQQIYMGDSSEIEKYSRINLTKKLITAFENC